MSFYSAYFSYDNKSSAEFGLRISSEGGSNYQLKGATIETITQSVYRKPKVHLLGVKQGPVLKIPISMYVPTDITAEEASPISRWLFSRTNYKVLKIMQPDMMYVYYNCFFTNPSIRKIGHLIRGFNATIECDSPYAWTYPETKTYTYNSNAYTTWDRDIEILNLSDNPDYTYPNIVITMNVFGGNVSIMNLSDDNRNFYLHDLDPNEVITIDNTVQTITSSTGANRLPNFNYKWLRYIPGNNKYVVDGNVLSVAFTNTFAKKVV